MKPVSRISLALVLVLAAMQGSCGSDDPTRVGRPPVVRSFAPDDQTLIVYVGDAVDFRLRAVDPDSDPLTTTFTIGGAVLAQGETFQYTVDAVGDVTIRGTVADGEYTSFVEWKLTRKMPANPPPLFTTIVPVETDPRVVKGNDILFSVKASDPDGASISYWFTVDDVVVSTYQQFTYNTLVTGTKIVRAFASDGVHTISREWRLKVTDIPDALPPAPVDIVRAETGREPGEIDLDWIAVGKDGMDGVASLYRVRTLPTPIVTDDDWNRASEQPDVPAPLAAGELMSMTLSGLQPARTTYIAVRAEDDFSNKSPILESPSATTRGLRVTGVVLDARTLAPVPGATLSLGLKTAISDAAGQWVLEELGVGTAVLATRDETGVGVGAYFDYLLDYNVVHEDVVEVYLLPNLTLQSTLYADFLAWFRTMTDAAGNPYGTETRRWELPITLYVRPFAKDGLDYAQVIAEAAAEFNATLGQTAFNVVNDGVVDGVETVYLDNLPHDNYRVQEWTDDWYPHLGIIQFRTIYDVPSRAWFAKVARHELGHAIGLNHSFDAAHLMVGGMVPQVDTFSSDEVAVMVCLYHMPRGWNARGYQRE